MRVWKIAMIAVTVGAQVPAFAAGIPVKLYRNPNCGCCETYAQYLTANGFAVDRVSTNDLTSVKKKYNVPQALEGCHTAIIDGYVFEGLVPAEDIKRVLDQHRPIKGLSVVGMPMGAPGMTGTQMGSINVYYLSDVSPPAIFATF